MRFSLASLAVLAALAVPAAHADTFTMTFTPSSGAASVFTMDTSKNAYNAGIEYIFLNTPDVSNGVSSTFGRIDLLNTNFYSGFDLGLCANGNGGGCPGGGESWFTGPQLFSGNELNVGTFALSSGATVTISNKPVGATPEPGSLALLGTGVLGFAGVLKKRRS